MENQKRQADLLVEPTPRWLWNPRKVLLRMSLFNKKGVQVFGGDKSPSLGLRNVSVSK